MELKDILDLVHAGFTAEQITKLSAAAPAEPASAPAEPAPAPAEPAPAPAKPAPAQPVETKEELNKAIENPNFQELQKTITELTNTLRANAIRMGSGPQPQPDTVDSILASIINP